MKLAGEHSTTEPPMPLTIARLDGLLDCNLKHPGYLTKEDSKAREKKIPLPSPLFKTEDKKKLFLPGGKMFSHAGNRTPAAAVKAPNPNH